jgi:hypothetical protein
MKKMDRDQLYSEGVKWMSSEIPATLALPISRKRKYTSVFWLTVIKIEVDTELGVGRVWN